MWDEMESLYTRLNSAENDGDDEEKAFLGASTGTQSRRTLKWLQPLSNRSRFSSALTTILSSLILASLFVTIRDHMLPRNDYEYGFSTDIATPFRIPMVKVRASGSPIFKPGNVMEMPSLQTGMAWPENVSYTGNGDQEEEDNWAVLIDQASFPITLEEAKRAWPDNYQEYYLEKEGKYRAAMDMFHTLHCVNVLRRLAYPDAYERDHDPHIFHCLEMVRQHVMCYGSTTLIPTKWAPEINQPYIDSNQVHTCRDFNTLHAYMMARRDSENALYAGNQPRE